MWVQRRNSHASGLKASHAADAGVARGRTYLARGLKDAAGGALPQGVAQRVEVGDAAGEAPDVHQGHEPLVALVRRAPERHPLGNALADDKRPGPSRPAARGDPTGHFSGDGRVTSVAKAGGAGLPSPWHLCPASLT